MKTYTDIESAIEAAEQISESEQCYTWIIACFGLQVVKAKRLHNFAPSDAYRGANCYWYKGIQKPFTEKQWARDWANTPVMS